MSTKACFEATKLDNRKAMTLALHLLAPPLTWLLGPYAQQ